MADIGAHQVEIYDPENPDQPAVVLAANFDPHTMKRWEHRHVAEPLPERGLVEPVEMSAVPDHEDEKFQSSTGEGDTGEEAAFRFERESGAHGADGAEPDEHFVTAEATSDDTKE